MTPRLPRNGYLYGTGTNTGETLGFVDRERIRLYLAVRRIGNIPCGIRS